MATASVAVVVWEWLDDFGSWAPYSSPVSNHIEHAYNNQHSAGPHSPLPLGVVDPTCSVYAVDLNQMTQIRINTARRRPIRRQVYPPNSPAARGVRWQWAGDYGTWHAYQMAAAELLEKARSQNNASVDLSSVGLSYTVDLKSMIQTKKQTGYTRPVQRIQLPVAYSADQSGLGISVPALVPVSASTSQPSTSSSPSGVRTKIKTAIGGFINTIKSRTRRGLSPPLHDNLSNKRFKPLTTEQAYNCQSAENVLHSFTKPVENPEKEDCPICCEELTEGSGYDRNNSIVVRLINCKHDYHQACLLSMYSSGPKDGSLQCPTCKAIHGIKMGNCPAGQMNVAKSITPLAGFPECGSLIISYNIRSGIQGAGHPEPGAPFNARGFPRICYLPDNQDGNKVCDLLREAWRRRLTFTIGNSATTGETNTVVWNEIHHKTEMSDVNGHGYPDPNYLQNVIKELEAQGVTP